MMNARRSPSIRLVHTAIMLVFGSLLLTAGHAATLAQPDTQVMAIQYFDGILGKGNPATSSALMSPDALLHTPEGVFRGATGASDFGARLQESFSDLSFATRSSETVGDYIVVEFMMTGIHTGTYHGLQPDCASVAVSGMAVLQADSTGVTEQWVAYDSQPVLDQIYVFSLFNPDGRPGCGDSWPLPERVAPPGAPACTRIDTCESPF